MHRGDLSPDELLEAKAFVQDAEDYTATLYTRSDFGCVLHETDDTTADQ